MLAFLVPFSILGVNAAAPALLLLLVVAFPLAASAAATAAAAAASATAVLTRASLHIYRAKTKTKTLIWTRALTLQVQTDPEALQQIIIHLLQNASSACLVEGTVTLRIQLQTEDQQDYLLIQVTDTGGGIQAKDIPNVFQRRYRADNVLIQGLGDTGVGLSICKSLVEAQNGRLWVETRLGAGSTFSVLLPVTRPASTSKGA